MTNTSYIVEGVVYDPDGSTLSGASIKVWLYNKTKDELKTPFDNGNEDLQTNASSEFQGNLGNFPTQWEEDDVIFVSCRSGSKTAMNRFTVDGAGQTVNLTLEELEPVMNIVKFLRMRMRDFNTTRDNTGTMIFPNYPRSQKLTKNSYPRLAVEKLDEETLPASIATNKGAKQIIRLKITSLVWGVEGDYQEFTVDDTSYEGSGALDKVSREVSEKLREGFYTTPRYLQDPHLQDYYSYVSDRNENLEFDEDLGLMINEIEIQIEYIRQT